MKRYFIIIFFSGWIVVAMAPLYGQNFLFPAHLNQLQLSKGLVHPVLQSSQGKLDLTSLTQQYSSQFSQVRNVYLQGSAGFSRSDTALLQQRFGVRFVSEQEGEYITRTKFYLTYHWSRQLFRNLRLSAAVVAGRANYTFNATQITSTSTAGNWDGDIGIGIIGRKFKTAFTINQFFNSTIMPLSKEFIWRRFYTMYGEKSFDLTNQTVLSLFLQSSLLPGFPTRTDAGAQVLLSEKVLLGANYYFKNSITFSAGLLNLHFKSHHVNLLFSYTSPMSKQVSINVQTYELGAVYYFKQ